MQQRNDPDHGPASRRLNDLLRAAARAALPIAGAFDAPSGVAAEMFGIETEGLSPEDRDLEIARRMVRLATDAAQRLSDSGDPVQAARRALLHAAQQQAPGLASHMRNDTQDLTRRWMRRPSTTIEQGERPMHDLDRTLRSQESETESYDFESQLFETESDYETESYELTEEQEIDLAAELLAVSDEQELDEFFRKLFNRAKSAVGSAARKYLKPLAKKAIPFAARAIGGYFGGPAGANLAGKVGDFATTLFEADFEGMEGEEQQMEMARRFVRFASAAANNAAAAGPVSDPNAAARSAIVQAAKVHAPGLVRPRRTRGGNGSIAATQGRGGAADSGRWIRRGSRIVIMGV